MGRSLRAPSHARRALWTAALAASLIAIASSRCFADHRAVHVGLDIQSRDRKFVVINVWQGSAGDEYGVLVGDIVLAINGSTLNPDDLQAFFDLIRHPGEDMRLELLGVDGGRKSLVLPKDACKPPSGHMAAGTPESPRLDDLPSSSSMDSAPVRLLHPQRNEVTNSRMLSFAWAKVPGAVSYGFELLRPLPYRGSDQVLSAVTDINQFCCFNVPLDWILGRHTYIAYAVTALGPDGAVIARSVPRDGVFVNRDDSIVEDLLSADPPARDSARRRLNRRCYAGRVREAAALARYLETGPPGARAAALEGLARSDVRYQTGWISKAFPLLDDADPAQRRAAHLFIATAIARMRADSFNHGEAFPILASASKHPSLRPDVIAAVDRMGPPPEKEMDTLRRWLEDADPGKRATAASALGLLRSSASFAVPDLLGLGRKDPDPWVRQQAMLALSRAGPAAQAAVPSLRQDLSSPNPESAGNAATALSGIGSGAVLAVGDLISLAERSDTQAGINAIKALGDIGPPANASVLPLLRLLKDPQRRASCKAALQKIGAPPPSVIPELQTFLSDPDPDLREWGARELGWLGKDAKAAVAALIRMIDDPYATVQIAAMDALGGIGQDASPAVPNLIRAMEGKFSGIGTQAVPHPSGMLVEGVIPGGPAEAEGVRRGDVIVSIDGLETSSMPFYQAWRLLRGAPGTEARIVVQRGGGGGYGGEIIGFLVTRAEMTIPEAAYNGVIPAAIMSLGKIGKPAARALPGLLAILDTDPSRPNHACLEASKKTLSALAAVDDTVLATLAARLEDADIARALRLISALQGAGPKAALAVSQALKDPTLRHAAESALGKMQPLPTEALMVMTKHADSFETRQLIMQVVRSSACPEETRLALASAVLSTDTWTARDPMVLREIGEMGPPARTVAPAVLAILIDSSTPHYTILAAGEALGKILPAKELLTLAGGVVAKPSGCASGCPDISWALSEMRKDGATAIPLLREALLAESVRLSSTRRSLIIQSLGQMGPSAAPLLSGLVGDPDPMVGLEAARGILAMSRAPSAEVLESLAAILRSTGTAIQQLRYSAAVAASRAGPAGADILAPFVGDPHTLIGETALAALMSQSSVKRGKIEALILGQEPVARARLERALKAPDARLFLPALAQAARRYGDAEAFSAIALVAPECAEILGSLLGEPVLTNKVEPVILRCYDSSLRTRSHMGGPLHMRMLSSDPAVSASARRMLSSLGVSSSQLESMASGSRHFMAARDDDRYPWLKDPAARTAWMLMPPALIWALWKALQWLRAAA